MPRELMPCGTVAAYKRHVRRGEEPCGRCREAESLRWRGGRPRVRGGPVKHGEPEMYGRGCRCTACCEASAVYRAAWRAGADAEGVAHGLSRYSNYGCRCETCRAAKRDYNAGYHEARRAREAASR